MDPLSESTLLAALRGSRKQGQPLQLNACLQNVPFFLQALAAFKNRRNRKLLLVDTAFLTSLKALVQSATANQKNSNLEQMKQQWLGFFLIAKTIDPTTTLFPAELFHQSANVLLQAVNGAVSKNELTSELSVTALGALQTLLKVMDQHFDSKALQAALVTLKSIIQAVVRKLSKQVASLKADPSQLAALAVPLRLIMKALVECLDRFPSSFKQITGSNRQAKKKDTITQTVEDLAALYASKNKAVASECFRFLTFQFKSRDKAKAHFREWVTRCVSNLEIYLDAIRPRLYSEDPTELNKEVPVGGTCFSFIFDSAACASQENLEKLTVKDLKDEVSDLAGVKEKLAILFQLLELTFSSRFSKANMTASQQPLHLQVEIDLPAVLAAFSRILQLKATGFNETQQVNGLPLGSYRAALEDIKFRLLSLLPSMMSTFGNLMLPFVANDLPAALKTIVSTPPSSDLPPALAHSLGSMVQIDRVLELIDLGKNLIQAGGLNCLDSVKCLLFNDLDSFNLTSLLLTTVQAILQKRDDTVIDIQGSLNSGGHLFGKIADAGAMSTMKHNKDNRLWSSLVNFDSHFLEETLLQTVLDCLEVVSKQKVFLFLSLDQRVKLQSAVCFNVLSASGLQHNHGLSASSSLCKLVRIAGNLITNCNAGDGSIQNEMLGALQSFQEKAHAFEMSNYPGSQELSEVLEQVLVHQLDPVVAPRKQEKYNLPQNTLTHLALERRGLFIAENQTQIKNFIIEQRAPAVHQQQEDSEQEEEEKPKPAFFKEIAQPKEEEMEAEPVESHQSVQEAEPDQPVPEHPVKDLALHQTAVPTLGGEESSKQESAIAPFKESQGGLPTHFKSSAALLEQEAKKNEVVARDESMESQGDSDEEGSGEFALPEINE